MEKTWMSMGLVFAALMGWMFLVWLLSLVRKDASIVDVFWGLGFILTAGLCLVFGNGFRQRQLLVLTLVTIWGLRLAIYIFSRNHGKPEDYRYQAMRRYYGSRFPLASLVIVFWLQGALIWIVSFPIQISEISGSPQGLTSLDFIGAAVWLAGLLFESIGDFQLAGFKRNPQNKGKVMDRGLWRFTRHPNYFGDALSWWGIFLIALATPNGYWTSIGPAVMTFLLMRVSGVALLEKTLVKTKPEYQEYVRRTSAFVPLPPRKGPG